MHSKLAIIALAAVTAAIALAGLASAAPSNDANIAKTGAYCKKQAKAASGKLKLKNKSAKFFLYWSKRQYNFVFCSESPKFWGVVAAGSKAKASKLKVVRKKCAAFQTVDSFDGTRVQMIDYSFFKPGKVRQTFSAAIGGSGDKVSVKGFGLSTNCVIATGSIIDGVPTLHVVGMPRFGYTGYVSRQLDPSTTSSELKKLRIKATSKSSARVTWKSGGVAQSYDYVVE